ncbi:tetratricopeptide repeat protein [Gemmatimonadota bacterium Y43]|uniref:helix-turn-helix domain-containing protein n=1 Tax=Gaopeijia maritima TaxID=3119007 RepID=UPI003294C847
MTGYTTREVSEVLGIPPDELRRWARRGLLDASKGPGGGWRFSFPDIILLRAAEELRAAGVPARRISRALRGLADQLPAGRPLSAVHIAARGDEVLVRDADTTWAPETGQVAFDFSVGELATRVEPFAARMAREREDAGRMAADDWYDLGFDLEAVSLAEAQRAYSEALRLRPGHPDALVNLGRLRHEEGDLGAAEEHYRAALREDARHAVARFNLGVVLEDSGRTDPAIEAYRAALAIDPDLPQAHFNLARLLEQRGDVQGAVRHLATYRRLRAG